MGGDQKDAITMEERWSTFWPFENRGGTPGGGYHEKAMKGEPSREKGAMEKLTKTESLGGLGGGNKWAGKTDRQETYDR